MYLYKRIILYLDWPIMSYLINFDKLCNKVGNIDNGLSAQVVHRCGSFHESTIEI